MNCQNEDCQVQQSWFRERVRKRTGYFMDSNWYCSEDCLQAGILNRLEKSARPRERSNMISHRARFGFFLLQYGVVTKEQLDLAIAEQQKGTSGADRDGEERLGHYLQNMGFIKERDITVALSRQFSLPVINLNSQKANLKVIRMVPPAVIERLKFIPLDYDATSNSLSLVTYDPCNMATMINLRGILDCDLSIFLGDESQVRQLIDQVCAEAKEEDKEGKLVEDSSSDLIDISQQIVGRSRHLNAKSLAVGYFNPLVWSRFFGGTELYDQVLEYCHRADSSAVFDERME
jgi:hypothetical protein